MAGIPLTWEAEEVEVKKEGEALETIGTPLNYPNPFNPSIQTTKITYTLTTDMGIEIYIFDIRGMLIWKRSYVSGSMGGKAGYNEVEWNGKDDFGYPMWNGIYPFRIVSGGKILGRGRIAVLE